jgi:DNA-directed RNA polymerase subunit M/transcription elongation factor TFIIS
MREESLRCPKCRKANAQKDGWPAGILWRVTQSRLEDGLGHRTYQCDHCGAKHKFTGER